MNDLTKRLPEYPTEELKNWILRTLHEELGGDMIVFKCASVPDGTNPSYYPFACYGKEKYRRGSECRCTACGERFNAGYDNMGAGARGKKGIVLYVGDDGETYSGYAPYDDPQSMAFYEDNNCDCPMCSAKATVVHSGKIHKRWAFRRQVSQLIRIGDEAVIMYWMAERDLWESGKTEFYIFPRYAVQIGTRANYTYTHIIPGEYGESVADGWRMMKGRVNPEVRAYNSHEAPNRGYIGSFVYPDCPDMSGTAAEKTGVTYMLRFDAMLYQYIKLWRMFKAVENLARYATWGACINEHLIPYAMKEYGANEIPEWCDISKKKPHEILKMTKEEFREATKEQWIIEEIRLWHEYSAMRQKEPSPLTPMELKKLIGEYGYGNIRETIAMIRRNRLQGSTLREVIKYLNKQQGDNSYRIQYFRDYRRMLEAANEGAEREYTFEELWPRRLRQAHDRLAEEENLRIKAEEAQKFREDFERIKTKCAGLEYKDERLCTILPRDNMELVQEGKVLRHCVGGYGKSHTEGRIILFVRHRRRPERSYYTLNVDITGNKPYIIQLHGYGNERHGEHKQYSHSIPKEVTEFVDRWKNEVYAPWLENYNRQKAKEKKAANG